MTDLFDPPTEPIPRDRWDRPLVTPPEGGKRVAYTRATTFVDCLDDKYNLQQWEKRMVAVGLSMRPDLMLAVSAHSDPSDMRQKRELDRITEQAKEAAKASAAATTGTALHALTERIDRGEDIPAVPDQYRADLEAYQETTAGLEPMLIEAFTVHDELKIGGTPDRVYRYECAGYIGDVKTGNVDFGALKIAMQLAVYSRSQPYDHTTNQRRPYPIDVSQDWGLVVHLPAGAGKCELRWIDLNAGWDAVQLARQVRQWRNHKHLYQPFTTSEGTNTGPGGEPLEQARRAIEQADTVDTVRRIYTNTIGHGVDSDALLALCLARKTQLDGQAG